MGKQKEAILLPITHHPSLVTSAAMQYTHLGNTGLKVSKLCLGCMSYGAKTERWPWALDEAQSRPFIKHALELGINFFDTANIYTDGAGEEVLGRALRDFAKRDEVVVATKVFGAMGKGPNDAGLSRKHIMWQIDASLKRLGTDYVDLYQIHRWDHRTPIEETLDALNDIVKAGKARYIGASSMAAWQFSKALYTSELRGLAKFVSMQPQYNLIYREEEREMLPLCTDQGIGVIPWSPLARGFLAGNRTKEGGATSRSQTDAFAKHLYYRDDDFAIVDTLTKVAKARGTPNMKVALAWLLSKPVVTAPIIGATQIAHLDDAVDALGIKLSDEEIKQLEEPYKPHVVRDR
jgi:aryl-alcohol dehydrogenase-like predicted oxidoreductase